MNEQMRKHIVRKNKENPKQTAAKLAKDVYNELGISANAETLRQCLKQNNIHFRVSRKKNLFLEM